MAALSQVVPPSLAGARADRIVAELAGVSRADAKRLIEIGVLVDGRQVAGKDRLPAGALMQLPNYSSSETPANDGSEISVRYQDDHLIVVDKPAGLVVHSAAGRRGVSLASLLLARFPELEGVGDKDRWGLVHRLDRDTSGLLLVARTADTHQRLRAQLAARQIARRYLGLAHGSFDLPTGTIDAPIERDPHRPMRRRVGPGGRLARTHYRVVETFPGASLLEIDLDTGRTHQIRVHLAAIRHPLVGDRAYSRYLDPVEVPRIFLHAFELHLDHPATGQPLHLRSPLPEDLQAVLDRLRRRSG